MAMAISSLVNKFCKTHECMVAWYAKSISRTIEAAIVKRRTIASGEVTQSARPLPPPRMSDETGSTGAPLPPPDAPSGHSKPKALTSKERDEIRDLIRGNDQLMGHFKGEGRRFSDWSGLIRCFKTVKEYRENPVLCKLCEMKYPNDVLRNLCAALSAPAKHENCEMGQEQDGRPDARTITKRARLTFAP